MRRVRIVGGDFDQQELAQALDHDALNMAAAMYYQHMFGNKPGIVYSAGVDHAERVAAAMRVVGLKAAAVSGRTPPRELAFTLAAYERGEINVLVNAQLLAEGWNAPRATVCMHLAPTASKRVYQQRIGRIMRLHRRKEAGVVVDFTEATSPHTDRTVTVHSLLGVDVYPRARWSRPGRPGGGSAGGGSRSRSSARRAGWCRSRPTRSSAARSSSATGSRSPSTACRSTSRALGRERRRRVGQERNIQKLAKVLTSVSEETRMLFFATCAAENKHRQLRLIALGDLAQNRPTANVFERAVRLVEAAPTWRLDRAQGSRTLLLALGDRRVEASDHQLVAWAWRLARASRDAQFRHLTSAHESGRDVARALAGKSGDDVVRAAKGIAALALNSPLDLGAALLAVVQTTDLGASRILEDARDRLSGDAAALAAALGANIPLPRAPRRPQPAKRPSQKPAREAAVVEAEQTETADAAPAGEPGAPEGEPKKRKRRRRRRRGGGQGAAGAVAATGETVAEHVAETPPAPAQSEEPAPAADRPARTRRPKAVALEATVDGEVTPPVAASEPVPPSRGARAGRRPSPPSDVRPGPARPGWHGLPGPRRGPRRGRRDHRAASEASGSRS